jgi:phosphoglycerate kinase
MKITNEPKKPIIAIMGGSKVSDKILVIENLLKIVDKLLICGGMANTFVKAQGKDIGNSFHEPSMIDTAKKLFASASEKIVLPTDFYCNTKFEDGTPIYKTVDDDFTGLMALDIGKNSVKEFNKFINNAGTIF